MSDSDRIYLNELADLVERAAHTVRQWVKDAERMKRLADDVPDGYLPESLWPEREGGREKMYWKPEQVEALRAFAEEREARRGWGRTPA